MSTASPAKPKKLAASDLKFSNDRQRTVMNLVLNHFKRFSDREQHHYLLNGMSTHHVMVDVVQTPEAIKIFWPPELVIIQRGAHYGSTTTIYQLEDEVFTKVNSSVRNVLDQLAKKDYLEKIGNEDERRWRPVKALRGVTLD